MKTTFFTVLTVLFFALSGQGQSCLPNGITFYTQAEVDQFPIDHPGCTAIEGEVVVVGSEVANLDGLLGVKTIGGQLFITSAYGLGSLHGLDSLAGVGGNLWLINSNLSDLGNLQSLQTVGGEIWLGNNFQMTSLSGLEKLATVGGNLRLTGNEKLASLDSMNHLSSVGGNIEISGNLVLNSLTGLESVANYHGSISIVNNAALTDLHGLENMVQLGGDAIIENNAALASLNGLNNLSSVGGNLSIQSNSALTDLTALLAISGAGQLHVVNNPGLADLSGLDNLTAVNGDAEISQNSFMATLNNLSNLHAIGGNLTVSNLPALTDINGLSGLTTLGGDLVIEQNPLLANLAGLSNIGAWHKSIYISVNYGLESLHGLESLDSLPGNLSINGCQNLLTLAALDSLTFVGGNFEIQGNQSLADLTALQHLTRVDGLLEIKSNYYLQTIAGLENITSLGGFSLFNNNSLKSPSGLGYLKHIPGSVSIDTNPALENLNGLDSLRTVGGDLRVTYNGFGLKSLEPLGGLTAVGGDLFIEFNDGLFSLAGLEQLKTVGGDFLVGGLMYDYSGLEGLTAIGGSVDIIQNPNLSSLHGLDSLHTIGGLLGVSGNNNLVNLQGLNGLTSVGGRLIISGHFQLQSLSGLDKLREVGGTIEIKDNHFLSDCAIAIVCGFLNYEPDSIILTGNYGVCNEPGSLPFYCQRTPVVVSVQIDADGDCLPDTPAAPAAGAAIRLRTPIQNTGLHPTDSLGVAHFLYYNNGPFTLDLPQLSPATWAACSDSIVVTPAIVSDTLRAAFLITPLSQCPDLVVQLGLPSVFRGCLVHSTVQATTTNGGTVPAEGVKVAVVMPPVFDLVSAEPPVTMQHGDTLFFALDTLLPFARAVVKLTVKTRCDTFLLGQTLCWEAFATLDNACPDPDPPASEIKLSAQCVGDTLVRFILKNAGNAATQAMHRYTVFRNDLPLNAAYFALAAQQSLSVDVPADGATYRMEATKYDDGTLTATALENCGGLTPGFINAYWLDKGPLAYDFDCRSVAGSFDPNLKSAVPAGVTWQQLLPPNQPLLYTIDFQNTGTDTAYRVQLIDLLPYYLDISTFRPVAASHPCTWDIRGGQMTVLFDPIMLPDSNTNEPASHGYFSFSIDQQPDVPDGTYLDNIAGITFDFNPVIQTNLVHHTIGQLTIAVQVKEEQSPVALWLVSGNPVRETAIFRATEFIEGEKQFELFDAAGRQQRQEQFHGQSFEFQREKLPEGIYFFRIEDSRGRVFSGKMFVAL